MLVWSTLIEFPMLLGSIGATTMPGRVLIIHWNDVRSIRKRGFASASQLVRCKHTQQRCRRIEDSGTKVALKQGGVWFAHGSMAK
jgi:hypothetical protein